MHCLCVCRLELARRRGIGRNERTRGPSWTKKEEKGRGRVNTILVPRARKKPQEILAEVVRRNAPGDFQRNAWHWNKNGWASTDQRDTKAKKNGGNNLARLTMQIVRRNAGKVVQKCQSPAFGEMHLFGEMHRKTWKISKSRVRRNAAEDWKRFQCRYVRLKRTNLRVRGLSLNRSQKSSALLSTTPRLRTRSSTNDFAPLRRMWWISLRHAVASINNRR